MSSKINELHNMFQVAEEMKKTKTCPYSKFIGFVNKFTNILGAKAHMVHSSGSKDVAAILGGSYQDYMSQDIDNTISLKQKVVLDKHAYDIEFLEKGLYTIIQRALGENIQRNRLGSLGDTYDLRNIENRELWGNTLIQTRQVHMSGAVKLREAGRQHSLEFQFYQHISYLHSMLSKGDEQSFGDIFIQGAGDGFANVWSLVYNLPELFEAKHKRLPNAKEYIDLVRQNIRSFIKPLASINLAALVCIIRPEDSVEDLTILANNSLEMNPIDFALDDTGNILINNSYLEKKRSRLLEMYQEYKVAQLMLPDFPLHEFPIRTGCPALRAKAEGGKVVIDQFCEDVLGLLEKIYFANRDKHI